MRSDRDIFNDHVAALARDLGVDLGSFSEGSRRRMLHDVRQRHLNDHEAALTVAYDHVRTLLEHDLERARVLVDRLSLIGRQWREANLVNGSLLEPLEHRARRELRSHQC